ncbi:MAG: VanW family protein [Terrisporobacter sp.]|uniref:VanW family protein n=1 Tax=Terrisporobacter sp. TaxID=1965305 RepID=UPI002FCB7768
MSNDKNKNSSKKKRNITRNTKEEKITKEEKGEETINDKEETKNVKIETVDENKTININKHKKLYIVGGCICILLGIIYFSARRYDNLVYPNVELYNEDISKLNEKELENKINDTKAFIGNNTITVKVEDKSYDFKVKDLVKDYNEDKTENEIYDFGRDENFLSQFGLITLGVQRNYQFDLKINEEVLKEKIKDVYKDSEIDTVEPTITSQGDKLSIKEGENGKAIDKKDLNNKIVAAINSSEIGKTTVVINEKYKTTKPKIDVAHLKKVDTKISTATTYYGGTGYNRGLNIDNAANKINNTILMPGEEFSYEEAVSPVELYNGYYMAPVIVNGTHKDAPGGGVCQVSSTLYNAELKAGILPTERYNHSKSVSYVQRGLDATLATGSKNLKFKNTYDYPVYIRAYTVGGQITVEFWSNSSVTKGKKYTPVSFVQGNVANTYLYEYNSKGELVNKTYIDTSIYG